MVKYDIQALDENKTFSKLLLLLFDNKEELDKYSREKFYCFQDIERYKVIGRFVPIMTNTELNPDGQYFGCIMLHKILKDRVYLSKQHAIIAHECFHAVSFVLKVFPEELALVAENIEHEEVTATLLGYFIESVNEVLYKDGIIW